MVWFQCEDCGDNLKKPKLANHFHCCRASRFSCIDCGAVFDRQSVQQHTQCVSETEKYGPKGGAPRAASAAKNAGNGNGRAAVPDEIINMGLSTRPPWSCSLCHIKATGREVLLVHGRSKRHGSKARAAIAARNPPIEQALVQGEVAAAATAMIKVEESPPAPPNAIEEKPQKKRKKSVEEKENLVEDVSKIVRWRKLISGQLKKSEDGIVKKRKLEKTIIPAAMEAVKNAGMEADATALKSLLETYLASSRKFSLQGKSVRRAAKQQ